jgi:hypothetical protein
MATKGGVMETGSIAGSSLLYNQQTMSVAIMKQAANQQNQMANLLAENVQSAPQPASTSDYNFSIYA